MIKILHLYYDIMNMYGESANIRALEHALDKEEVKYKIDFKSLHDDIKIMDYDFIYIGTGLDESYSLVLEDLKKYKEDLIKYIDDNKFILVTGNALDLFSDLKILNFKSVKEDFRIIGEQVYTTDLIKNYVIGFQNRNTVIKEYSETPLFKVTTGTGFAPNNKNEGIRKNNFYGTYLLGPLLIRNPYLLEYFTKNLLKMKNLKYKAMTHDTAYQAYEAYLKNFVNKETE